MEKKQNRTATKYTGHTYRNFKRGTEVPERKISPLEGTLVD
jgi:hypothetical protein